MTLQISHHKRLDNTYINLSDVRQIKEFEGKREFVIIEKAELERLKSLEAKEAKEPKFKYCEAVIC